MASALRRMVWTSLAEKEPPGPERPAEAEAGVGAGAGAALFILTACTWPSGPMNAEFMVTR